MLFADNMIQSTSIINSSGSLIPKNAQGSSNFLTPSSDASSRSKKIYQKLIPVPPAPKRHCTRFLDASTIGGTYVYQVCRWQSQAALLSPCTFVSSGSLRELLLYLFRYQVTLPDKCNMSNWSFDECKVFCPEELIQADSRRHLFNLHLLQRCATIISISKDSSSTLTFFSVW